MIRRYVTAQLFLFGIGVLVIAVGDLAVSQDAPDTPVSPASADQGKPTDVAKEPGDTPNVEVTDADRIMRLETSIGADKKQLGMLQTELQKAQTEEESANASLQQLSTQLETTKSHLQKAKDSADTTEAANQQTLLTELEPKHRLATEQFNLAIQTRKTVQEQIATLDQKMANDQESLNKLKGVPSPETAEVESPTSTGPATPSESAAPVVPQPGTSPQSTETDQTEPEKEVVVSKELAKAREAVQDKAKSLQDLEQDLDALADSKLLLEKSIELESEKLENARQKYDAVETAMELAEKEFNEKLVAGIPAGEQQQLRTQISETQQRMRDARGDVRSSTDRLQELRKQLLALQAEETQLVKQSEELRREMAAAKRSEWVLKLRDYLYTTVPKIVVIVVLTIVLWIFVKIVCGRSRAWIAHTGRGTAAERQNRADTLAGVFQNTGNVAIVIGSLLMILDAAGVPIAALLGGAGVVGLAVAFGAQSLIKDFFCGLILLLENQYKVNDFVTIGGLSGTVERITLRITVLRDFEGKVYFIPNGQITSVTNSTLDWSRAVLEIGVAYKENVDHVIQELQQLTDRLRKDPEYSAAILGDIEMLGVDNLGASSVIIKFGVKTQPDKKWPVKRELLRRIKNTFDEQGIEIPFPHQTVIHRTENGGPARLTAEKFIDHAAQ